VAHASIRIPHSTQHRKMTGFLAAPGQHNCEHPRRCFRRRGVIRPCNHVLNVPIAASSMSVVSASTCAPFASLGLEVYIASGAVCCLAAGGGRSRLRLRNAARMAQQGFPDRLAACSFLFGAARSAALTSASCRGQAQAEEDQPS